MLQIDAETRRKIVECYLSSIAMVQQRVADELRLPVAIVRDVLDYKL